MPHPLLRLTRAARTRVSAATASAGALMAGATLLLAPRAAHASEDELYQMCLDAVYALASRCLRSADSFFGDVACMWVGGVGYITCAVLEAIRQLIPGGGINIT